MGGDRGAGHTMREVYRGDGRHGACLRRPLRHEQIHRAYRGNIVERFVWVVE